MRACHHGGGCTEFDTDREVKNPWRDLQKALEQLAEQLVGETAEIS